MAIDLRPARPRRAHPASGVLLSLVLVPLGAAISWAEPIIDNQSSDQLAPGVELITGRTSNPGADFYAVRVSLCEPGVGVDATAAPGALQSARRWGDDVGALVAVNGDFFVSGPKVHGNAAGGGQLWPSNRTGTGDTDAPYYQKYGWIALGSNWVDFMHTREVKENPDRYNGSVGGFEPGVVTHDVPAGARALVSGYPEVVTGGVPYPCDDPPDAYCFFDRADMRFRHPRTSMGLSEDKQTLILLVVDGRSNSSAGMYGTELGWLMRELGAWHAFNLDGGGSSQIWVRGMGTINSPSDGSPRAVANHWGVFADSDQTVDCSGFGDPGLEPDAGSGTAGDDSDGGVANDDPGETAAGGCRAAPGGDRGAPLWCLFVVLIIARRRR